MCVCVCVCVCAHLCTCVHVPAGVCVSICKCVHVGARKYLCVCTQVDRDRGQIQGRDEEGAARLVLTVRLMSVGKCVCLLGRWSWRSCRVSF